MNERKYHKEGLYMYVIRVIPDSAQRNLPFYVKHSSKQHPIVLTAAILGERTLATLAYI